MAQDKKEQRSESRQKTPRPTADTNNGLKRRDKKEKESAPTKVVVRRLPPNLSPEEFFEQIAPVPEHTDFYFCRPDTSLGSHAVSRAYINFAKFEDINLFREKFDGYVFLDSKGNEYPVVVEFAPYQKCAKKKAKKPDAKKGTIEQDPDYHKFLESLEHPDEEPTQTIENLVEEIEIKEREQKASAGGKSSTPLLDYLKKKKEERRAALQRMREERKRKEQEKKRQKEEERRKRREKERERERDKERDKGKEREKERDGTRKKETPKKESESANVKLLKNPDRDSSKDSNKERQGRNSKETGQKDKSPGKESNRPQSARDRDRQREKERERQRERDQQRSATTKRSEGGGRSYRNERPNSVKKDLEKKESKDLKKEVDQAAEKEKADITHPTSREDINKSMLQPKKDEKSSETLESKDSQMDKVASEIATRRIAEEGSKGSDSSGKEEGSTDRKERKRYKDRPERAIYVPGRRRQEMEKQKKEPDNQGQGQTYS